MEWCENGHNTVVRLRFENKSKWLGTALARGKHTLRSGERIAARPPFPAAHCISKIPTLLFVSTDEVSIGIKFKSLSNTIYA